MSYEIVPAHINDVTGRFCVRGGAPAPSGRCPDGCDHAEHYGNDGHDECAEAIEEFVFSPPRRSQAQRDAQRKASLASAAKRAKRAKDV